MVQPNRSGSRLSILTPVFNPPEGAFEHCIASVLGQTSDRWEWCLVDDCSTEPFVRRRLKALAASDPRVRVELAEANAGIVAATNRALVMATGDIVAFLDNDDELEDVAVERVLATFAADPTIGIAYSDESLIDGAGDVIARYDKPDFSPERLRGHNYFAHLVAVDREYATASGGLREGFDGAQDNDFDLRAVEHFGGAAHIAERLYRWRAIAGSVAADPAAKPSTLFSAEQAVREHLERAGIDATTGPAPGAAFSFRLHRSIQGTPRVSFVVRGSGDSVPPLVGDAIREGRYSRVEVVRAAGAGAAALDEAIEAASGEIVIVVDGDLRLRRGDLVGELVPLAQDGDVAAVGPTLILPDGRLAASGITFAGGPVPVGFGDEGLSGPWAMFLVTREVSAVPAVCFAARRDAFLALGGLSTGRPDDLAGADYGMRSAQAGMRVLVSPFVQVTAPRTFDGALNDETRLAWVDRWGDAADRERFSPFDRDNDERAARAVWRHLLPAVL